MKSVCVDQDIKCFYLKEIQFDLCVVCYVPLFWYSSCVEEERSREKRKTMCSNVALVVVLLVLF